MSDSPQLARTIGLWGAVLLGLGSILGTGVFVSISIATGVAGAAVILAIGIAGIVATCNGLSSAQLAAAHPVSGGTYEYGYRFIHPRAGFAAGWMYLCAKSASAATAALGCVGYVLQLTGFNIAAPFRVGTSVVLVLAITGLVASGVRRSNVANAVIVSMTLVSLGAFVVAGLVRLEPTWPSHFASATAYGWREVFEATALMFVAYTGYGRVATLGEEVVNPSRTIPRAIVATLAVSMTLYLLVAFVAVGTLGAPTFAAAAASTGAPLEAVARALDLPLLVTFIAVGATTAMAGVLLNLVLGLSRVLFAMARRGDMPRPLAKVQSDSPTRAVWAIGIFVALLTCIGDIATTWGFSAFTVLVYYGLTNLAALRLPVAARRFPRIVSVVGLLSCLGLAFFVDTKIWVAGVAVLATGLIVREFARRREA